LRCPYCVSEIPEEAYACAHCAHDVYLFRPLQARIGELEKTVAEQAQALAVTSEQRVAALQAELDALKQAHEALKAAPQQPAVGKAGYAFALFQALTPVIVLLLAAHGILLFVYDVKPLYLRIATILIPMPFGALLAVHHPARLWYSCAAGFVLAALAVSGMLVITATIDKVPLMPEDARDWRETLEYVASIGLAFTTGVLGGEFYAGHKAPQAPANKFVRLVAKAVTPNEDGEFGIERVAKRVDKVVKAATPFATGAASVYAGVKVFLGQLG
jgi:uncharacterized coiled-coil protein SlyX